MISLAWVSLAGCSLDIKPQTNWSDGAFYETDGQVQSLLEGAYVKFENALSVGFMVYGDIRSDLYRCHNANKVDYLNIMENVITPYNTHASWANFYASPISFANWSESTMPASNIDGALAITRLSCWIEA